MPIERFFDSDLNPHDKEGKLFDEQMHHALKVFRLKLGDHGEIINGRGLLASVVIDEITKKYLKYKVLQSHLSPTHPPKCTLVLGMPKFTRLETIIEKVCELGCDEVILFNADRSEKVNLSSNQLARLNFILQAALKQSGRLFLPHIELKPNLQSSLISERVYYFGDVEAKGCSLVSSQEAKAIVIGPESGFSDQETACLLQKANSISLSDAILRVDTAAIVGVYLIKQHTF